MSEQSKKFRMSGLLVDEKEKVIWTFDLNQDRLLLAPSEPTTDDNRERYVLSGFRLLSIILSEIDPDIKVTKAEVEGSLK